MSKIFVQIVSYRDPELLNTIHSLLENAQYPENINIGIIWQHKNSDSWDTIPNNYSKDPRFRILDVDINSSNGVCWARNLVQQLYNNEKYCLQIDSHHRFVQHWDSILINMIKELQSLNNKKPIISSYLPNLILSAGNEIKQDIQYSIECVSTFYGLIPIFTPIQIRKKTDNKYIPSKFLSGHFLFTLGVFCQEIKYDPDYYFLGEEFNISARAFTYGYSFFTTSQIIAWHEYIRKNKPKHSLDISAETIKQRYKETYLKYKRVFLETSEEDKKRYFGNEKTLNDYIKHIKIGHLDRFFLDTDEA